MSSKQVEVQHIAAMEEIIAQSGLVCIRTPQESIGEYVEEGTLEEEAKSLIEEEKISERVEEEQTTESEDLPQEQLKEVFPTPSLRHMKPDHVRKIETINRVHGLPEHFRNDFDPEDIPIIRQTAPKTYIDILGELTGCKSFHTSLAEYWFLDTLANVLRRGQEDGMDKPAQAVLIQWFCQWMREMVYFDAADRQRMLRRFKENMLSAAKFINDESRLPVPLEAGVYHTLIDDETREMLLKQKSKKNLAAKSVSDKNVTRAVTVSTLGKVASSVTNKGTSYECALRDLARIMHYIFDLFSTDYQYNIVRSVFTYGPEYCLIDAPFQIQTPKTMYTVLKAKKGKDIPKKDKKKDDKGKKGKKGAKEVEPVEPTIEYLELMALKAYDEQQLELQEEREREEWNRRSHILPLTFAATEELFDKYWPPPTPPPEPEPEPVVAAKGKKGKGKK